MTQYVAARLIKAGNNDRKAFDQEELIALACSIEELGLQSPTIIRPIAADQAGHVYEIVAGERRFRAMTLVLGWTQLEIGAHIRISELDDQQASAIMLVENTGRVNLNPVEEGIAYSRRVKELQALDSELKESDAVAQVAKQAGVKAVTVRFRIKLLALRSDILDLVKSGNLATGYAQIMVEMGLNHNYQAVALDKFNQNSAPTPKWFRGICGELFDAQQQVCMFDDIDSWGYTQAAQQESVKAIEPPTPLTHIAPTPSGMSAIEMLEYQKEYWTQAAQQWQDLGKSFKMQQCSAASAALDQALKAIRALNDNSYTSMMFAA